MRHAQNLDDSGDTSTAQSAFGKFFVQDYILQEPIPLPLR